MINDPAGHDERVMTLAAEALKTPPGERDHFLKSVCQDDPELYREVSEIVAWEERMGGFLAHPLIEFVALAPLEKVFEAGQTVAGRFEILRRVGDGGMGVVYEAFDTKRKQRIAIKFAKPGFGRLLSPELEGALKVRHPNICVVNEIHTTKTEFGQLDFLTMEFLDGQTLASRLAKGRLEESEALQIARQLCTAVAEAHRSGILHRDLKPGNVILCPRKDEGIRAVITDFGLSTESSGTSEIGGGTPGYMAPELWRNEKPLHASDVFALGVILYEMVTGQKPFPAKAEDQAVTGSPVPPTRLVKGLSRDWDKAILPCLRPEPEERCTAGQILEALEPKPYYRRLVFLMLAAALVLVAALTPQIIVFLTPPPIRLVLLPVQASGELAERNRQILDDVAQRVKQVQDGKPTVVVVPLSKVLSKHVTTLEEAQKTLGATHALQLTIRKGTDGTEVDGAIIDLRTMAHVRDYSGNFVDSDLADLPTGLAGLVSWALHLHRKPEREAVVSTAEAAYKNGREYLDREPHDYVNAIPEFQAAERLAPHSPLPLAGLAEAHAREFQIKRDDSSKHDAQLWLARAEALNPDSPTVRMASGLQHTLEGDLPRALQDYERVEEIDPGNVEGWLGSAFAYELQGMLDKAMSDYAHAISVAPNYYKPYEYLGALRHSRGQYDQAEYLYKKAIELAPGRVDTYGTLAGIYTIQFKNAEAERVYRQALQIRETALTLNNLGAFLAFQKRPKEALVYFQRAVAKDASNPKYWLNLGDVQRRLGTQASARGSYKHGVAVAQRRVTANPANASARAYLAYMQARLGLKEQAKAEIAAALNSPARDDQVLLCAVETYEALGDRERALATAVLATPQTRNQMDHHPDLAGLQGDSRFRLMMAETKQGG